MFIISIILGVLHRDILFQTTNIFNGQPVKRCQINKTISSVFAFSLIPLDCFQGYKQFADGIKLRPKFRCEPLFWKCGQLLNYLFIYGIWIARGWWRGNGGAVNIVL
jgi:hypothetical protein